MLFEKQRQSVLFCSGAEERDDPVLRVQRVAVERIADLAVHPALHAGLAHQYDKVSGVFQRVFECRRPLLAGCQLVEVEPHWDTRVPEQVGNCLGSSGVGGGVTEEDVHVIPGRAV